MATYSAAPQTDIRESSIEGAGTFTAALSRLLENFTDDAEILDGTPERVFRALVEMTSGYSVSNADVLSARFDCDADELVILRDIDFVSLCEHHLMPFVGRAHVGYLPKDGVVGISKLARLVDVHARRLQIQERMCRNIAEALNSHVPNYGVAVLIEAEHACISCRGVRKSNTSFITSSMFGRFREDPKLRAEFMAAIGRPREW